MDELISKAATLLEALPYIQRFRNEVFVVKYGGSFMDSPSEEERDRVAGDIVFLETVGINPVVVHGGGKAITRALERAGVQTRFVDGQRVTDASTVEVVERVLSHEINPEIVSAIAKLGGKAQGFSGTEIFRCRRFASPRAPPLPLLHPPSRPCAEPPGRRPQSCSSIILGCSALTGQCRFISPSMRASGRSISPIRPSRRF